MVTRTKYPINSVMTQSEFDAELKAGKSSWPGSHIHGDLDISDRVINGNLHLTNMCIDGDLNLSGTVIHGELDIVGTSVLGDLDLNGLRVDKFLTAPGVFNRIEGDVIADDLVIAGRLRTLSARVTRSKNRE